MRSPGDYARTIFSGADCTCSRNPDVRQCQFCLCVMLFQEVCSEARPGEEMLQAAYGKGRSTGKIEGREAGLREAAAVCEAREVYCYNQRDSPNSARWGDRSIEAEKCADEIRALLQQEQPPSVNGEADAPQGERHAGVSDHHRTSRSRTSAPPPTSPRSESELAQLRAAIWPIIQACRAQQQGEALPVYYLSHEHLMGLVRFEGEVGNDTQAVPVFTTEQLKSMKCPFPAEPGKPIRSNPPSTWQRQWGHLWQIPCTSCGAAIDESCYTKSGVSCLPHQVRFRGSPTWPEEAQPASARPAWCDCRCECWARQCPGGCSLEAGHTGECQPELEPKP